MDRTKSDYRPEHPLGQQNNTTVYSYRNKDVHVPSGYIAVGLIFGVHGLKGEIRVNLHTDFPERFSRGAVLWLGEKLQKVEIDQARPHKGFVLLQLKGITTRAMADSLRGTWLFIAEDEAAELDEDTYWVHDIVGLAVHSTDGELLGTVQDVVFTGANEVYIVQPQGSVNGGRELLIPAIADVVQSVDLKSGTIVIRIIPGLIED